MKSLAKELIYNNYDVVHTKSSRNVFEAKQRSEAVGINTLSLLPSKNVKFRQKKERDASTRSINTAETIRRLCIVCRSKKSTNIFSL
eukprot:Pgem_evm1s4430